MVTGKDLSNFSSLKILRRDGSIVPPDITGTQSWGGGICQYADEWYRNWEYDYKPPEKEVVPEEPEETSQEVPEVPQDPPDDDRTAEQIEDEEGGESTIMRRSSEQNKPVRPKPPCTSIQPEPQDDPESLLTKNPLAPLSLEESKTRENNIAHIKHLREAMKKGLEKWNDEIRKEKDQIEQVWMRGDREKLSDWIADIEMVLDATKMSPVYVPTVKEEWIKVTKQKPTPSLESPDDPLPQPNKPKEPKPIRKYVAKKSGGR